MTQITPDILPINFYNTLTHAVEPFCTIEPGKVYMYNCGPTVYDYAHIGNFRAFVFADILRRFLELAGYDVTQVMNITDVGHMTEDNLADGGGEDKMEAAAKRLKESKKSGIADIDNPDDPYAVAKFFTEAFLEDSQKLSIKIADEHDTHMPHATDFVENSMIPMIQTLVDNDHAYVADDGAVYFSVESFPEYGKLSGNTLDHLRGGAGGRVEDTHQASKRHPGDFLLWKPDTTHKMKWDSPWGVGYPGWHIECSAMARSVLKRDVIDIHTGGEDNIFPHHECEIAQSCCSTGQSHFARFWMHTRFLLVEGTKMSKSKGNFYTIRDLIDGESKLVEDPAVLRYELIKAHYRSNMNFTRQGLKDSGSAVQKIRNAAANFSSQSNGEIAEVDRNHPVVKRFLECLADDLNVSGALAVVFEFIKRPEEDSKSPAESLAVLKKLDHVLCLLEDKAIACFRMPLRFSADATVYNPDEMCKQLDEARANKDYAAADKLRDQLNELGYDVKTTKEGTIATKRLA
ncbi:Cysteine--tRNA ligase [Poriferisphaera corsica]|uniref:Cysteine--tRNA ligase n=1 Tax=Poriferisphaera corsica TaxID=2528020 RepID=A0A517YV53_9BACT|nr:cysteine--tRNA ligase [Poriferisphaera corsica]QDU34105.1 Cysteine--tRNA ligase [Poriferisphaera corsica]